MQVGMAKRNRQEWMQEFFNGVRNSAVLCRPLENRLSHCKLPYTIEVKGVERQLHPPDVGFRIDGKIIAKLKEKVQRSRKSLQGVLVALSLDAPISTLLQITSEEDDLGALQQSEGGFCVGVSLLKQDGVAQSQRRIKYGAIYNHNDRAVSHLGEITKLMIRFLRIFVLIEQGRGGLQVGRLLFYPKASFPLRKIRISPATFIGNEVQRSISKMNFGSEVAFGYLTISKSNTGFKLMLLDKNDPELHQGQVGVFGVWVAGQLGSSGERETAFWSLIMEYFTDALISKRLSLVGERSGILIAFQQPNKPKYYSFELPANAKWTVRTQVETLGKIPEEFAFSQQEVIVEEEREESEVESMTVKEKRNSVEGREGLDSNSTRSLDQKDLEIRSLRTELELYKKHCKQLEDVIANLTLIQNSKNYAVTPQEDYPLPFSSYNREGLAATAPCFGKKVEVGSQYGCAAESKQFAVRDMKNMSFAQQNSFEEEGRMGVDCDEKDLRFRSPEFKSESSIRRDVVVAQIFKEQRVGGQELADQSVPVVEKSVLAKRSRVDVDKAAIGIEKVEMREQKYKRMQQKYLGSTGIEKFKQKQLDGQVKMDTVHVTASKENQTPNKILQHREDASNYKDRTNPIPTKQTDKLSSKLQTASMDSQDSDEELRAIINTRKQKK